ncbi:MAG: methylated-DNA--[protein]-cysteine S-methyltransferase [Nevskia sp.]|nr:methylated-DNA--[protein]-cysteine S-methyltransferase [Nevskia sp.]
MHCCRMASPIGPLSLYSDGQFITGLYMATGGDMDLSAADGADTQAQHENPLLREAQEQLRAYFAGELQTFDLPLLLQGTAFQQRVWQELRDITYGETISYRELAARVGQPKASRAVGLANGRNPISIVVPCHRVIGADGSLTGYGGGLPRKRWLLDHERGVPRTWLSLNLPE